MTRTADYPIDEQFITRKSPRAFSDKTVTETEVLTLLEAARWAPSAMNSQPWRFVYGLRGDAGFEAINASLVPFNQTWASKSAALIVIASSSTMQDKEGNTVPNPTSVYDAGQAGFSIALQAHLKGMIAHQMAGLDYAALGQSINLPAEHQIHAVMAVGYHGDAAALPDYMQPGEAASPRHALTVTAKHGTF